jgi:hypothetical protein
MAGVDTVVLGVKNRVELAECVVAAEADPLPADVMACIAGCFAGQYCSGRPRHPF